MNNKPTASKLADVLDVETYDGRKGIVITWNVLTQAAAMLREQAERIAGLAHILRLVKADVDYDSVRGVTGPTLNTIDIALEELEQSQ